MFGWKKGSFRLILIQVSPWWKAPEWAVNALKITLEAPVKDIGWLRTLYGFDIWVGPIPIIRTMIAANILAWILMWFVR